jgi:hypothetical protein
MKNPPGAGRTGSRGIFESPSFDTLAAPPGETSTEPTGCFDIGRLATASFPTSGLQRGGLVNNPGQTIPRRQLNGANAKPEDETWIRT